MPEYRALIARFTPHVAKIAGNLEVWRVALPEAARKIELYGGEVITAEPHRDGSFTLYVEDGEHRYRGDLVDTGSRSHLVEEWQPLAAA
jgi:hypothetical protein